MRTITITKTFYTFDELDSSTKQKAVVNLYYSNVDDDWWDTTYDDATNIGLKISEFDLGRGSYVKGGFTADALDVANKIISEHGDQCETYKTAQNYLTERQALVVAQCREEADWLCQTFIFGEGMAAPDYMKDYEIDTEEIDNDFLKSLCEDYRVILEKEYEYRTSDEAIIETIQANEYEFDENGNLA